MSFRSGVMPTVITGSLAAANRQAIDWGWQGFVAYGCQSFVVVWQPKSMEHIHTLDGHRYNVVKVRWARENYPHCDGAVSTYGAGSDKGGEILRLASADASGQVIVWDVLRGQIKCQFSDGGQRPVLEMHWLAWQDLCIDLLLALHAPYNLVLWNAQEGTRIWKKGYTETLISFALDPFQSAKAAFLTHSGSVMLIDDFSTAKSPSSNGQQFRVSNSQQANQTVVSDEPEANKGKQTAAALANLLVKKPLGKVLNTVAVGMTDFQEHGTISGITHQQSVGGGLHSSPSIPSMDSTADDNACLELSYHRAVRDRLLLLYPKELIVLDVVSMQSVAQVVLDRLSSPFVHVYSCSQRDALYFFQENGCTTMRLQKYRSGNNSSGDNVLDVYSPAEIVYESACSSESLRVTKTNRILAGAVCPVDERWACQIMSQGRFMVYELTSKNNDACLSDLVLLDRRTLEQETRQKLRFSLVGVSQALASNPTVVRACPKPSGPGRQLAAIGFMDGGVQLVDLHTGKLERDFSLHSCPVKCLEWSGADYLVSSGYCQTLSTSSVVRNEILLTDIRTGYSRRLRGEADESPAEMLRVSYFNCFLAIAFRDQPMEIWDLKKFRLLRRMSKNCPVIVDMAWSTKHHQSKVVTADENPPEQLVSTTTDESAQTIYRENLVVLDNENHLYHVVVKGIHVRDGKEVNTQWATNSLVTCMVWKDDLLAFGDSDGRLSVWNLESKTSKASGQPRGAVRRLQMSRSSGDFTLISLYADGVAVWNAFRFECLYHLQTTAAGWRLTDVDLAGDENWPVLLSGDGVLRVYDRTLSLVLANRNVEATINQKLFVGRYQTAPKRAGLVKTLLCDGATLCDCYPEEELISITSVRRESPMELIKRLDCDDQDKWTLIRQLTLLGEEQMEALMQSRDVGRRSLATARLFGDEWETHFWTVAVHYLTLANEGQALMPTSYEAYWECEDFKRWQVKQCSVFDCRRAGDGQLHKFIDQLIQLGMGQQASQLLLDTDCQQQDYYADCLKACLLSTLMKPDADSGAESTVKLVATNLIANGRLDEGVQLLTMIGKSLDACRYLQSFGRWERSAWLARVSLPASGCGEVLNKWADTLQSPQVARKTAAILLLISYGQWEKVIDLLIGWRQLSTAVRLLTYRQVEEKIPPKVRETVYCEYARYLLHLGLRKAARWYAERAGERGESVIQEIQVLSDV